MTVMDADLKDALRSLAGLEQREARDYGENETRVLEHLRSIRIERIDENTIQYLLDSHPGNDELNTYGTYLFLPRPDRGDIRIPVLNVLYDAQQTSFQVACFFVRDKEVGAIGYRYESNEEDDPDGKPSIHGYMHAQPSNAVRCRRGDIALPVPEPLVPDGEPALPLPAADPLDLLLCLLVSLYGRHQARRIVEDVNPLLLGRLGGVMGI